MCDKIINQYFYARENYWLRQLGLVKSGITTDPLQRDSVYITGEPDRGEFLLIIQIFDIDINILDKDIKQHYKFLNYPGTGGTEFYNKSIINAIESYLKIRGIKYHVLSDTEIAQLKWNKKNKTN
jgi:hypothetical protein